MRINVADSRYREDPATRGEFSRREVRRARYLLRRLRFLETKIEELGGMSDPNNGGGVHAELEMEALEWALGPDGVGFIMEVEQ